MSNAKAPTPGAEAIATETKTSRSGKASGEGESLRWRWLLAIRNDQTLSAVVKLVAYTLSLHMESDGRNCRPGHALLVTETNLSLSSVKDALRKLAGLKYLKIAELGGSPPGGQRRASVYKPTIPPGQDVTGSGRDRVTSQPRPGHQVAATGSPGDPQTDVETDMETERGTVEFDMYETFGGDVTHNLEQLARSSDRWKNFAEDTKEIRFLADLLNQHGHGAVVVALQEARDNPSAARRPGAWLRRVVPELIRQRQAS